MLRFMVEYDVKQTSENGTVRHITDERGFYRYSGTLDSRRAEVTREMMRSSAHLTGRYSGWWCVYANPRIVREYAE